MLLIKWRRRAYVHCSWEPLEALRPLAGFKRVLNYCRRQDQLAALLPRLTREERELLDVERAMEEQLWEQHKGVRGGGGAG